MWEQRWHPLREEWVIVAAHRQNRPWRGETLAPARQLLPEYEPSCYLCPGNLRVSGRRNEAYSGTFVFDNDHPCVGPDAPRDLAPPAGIYRSLPATGLARVVCYSPKHNLTLAELEVGEITALFRVWAEQYRELGALPDVRHVLVFENKGEAVGVSNPHPHCQIYATNFVCTLMREEVRLFRRHRDETGRNLFQDIIRAERDDGRRLLVEEDTAIAFVPYFARYAYEVYVAPTPTLPSSAALDDRELHDLAAVLKRVLVQYDNLWQLPFPYVLALHQAPTDGGDCADYHFHLQIQPPLRKPGLLKYLAGPEIGAGNFLSDTSPEERAAELRALPRQHYKQAPAPPPRDGATPAEKGDG